jgi:hypothetical protein
MKNLERAARALVILVTIAVAAACDLGGPDDVQIRVQNATGFAFDSVALYDVGVGDIEAGEFSPYLTRDVAYRYGPVSATVDGERLAWAPIDFVGEDPLPHGKYTYRMTLDAQGVRLMLELVIDER